MSQTLIYPYLCDVMFLAESKNEKTTNSTLCAAGSKQGTRRIGIVNIYSPNILKEFVSLFFVCGEAQTME